MQFAIGIICMSLAALVAFANICGSIAAYRRAQRGQSGGYSNVMVVSLILSIIAWGIARAEIGWWAFIPTMLDPGTWGLIYLPIFLIREHLKRRSNVP